MSAKYLLFTALFIVLGKSVIWSQSDSFPVQLIVQAIPPSPVNFSDYANESALNGPLRVQITLNDFTISNREVRLKGYFQGQGISFQTNDLVVGAPALFLEGGIPTVLSGGQLAAYFRLENILGVSPSVYNNPIPDGSYQFCFEVFDVLTGRKLSARSCATTVLFKNEPPFLVSPVKGDDIIQTNPQNIVFQWSPRHINVTNVEYELSLVEIWDTNVDPQTAFLTSPPVFQVTTAATTYVYGPSDPLLLADKVYAWRIQAKAKQGAEEIGLFKNQGYSEIFHFSYTSPCELPAAIEKEIKGAHQVNLSWEDFSTDIPKFTIRYRKKGTTDWFYSRTSSNWITIWDLRASTTYEYQVNKKCTVATSPWSTIDEFTTNTEEDASTVINCGIPPDINLENKEPLPTLEKGDSFVAGDFNIKVLESSGSEGRFTGKGYVTIPYLESIKVGVKFTNILVNTEKQLAEGTVITTYDKDLSAILDLDEVADTVGDIVETTGELFEGDNDLDEIPLNFDITEDDIRIEGDQLIIKNPDTGDEFEYLLTDDTVITDLSGDVYHVDDQGNITRGGQKDPGGIVSSTNVDGVSGNGQLESLTAPGLIVTFSKTGTYGFDAVPESQRDALTKHYETIKDEAGKDYTLIHQAVPNGGTTKILAKLEQKGDTYKPEDVIFKTKQGEVLPKTVKNDGTIEISLTGHYSFENETIYAVVPSKNEENKKQLTAGAFTLWHLTERAVDVQLISVNGAPVPSTIGGIVASIFAKGVAKVSIADTPVDFNFDPSLLGDNGIDIGESPWLTAYNEEQKNVIRAFKDAKGSSKNTYYLFVFDDIKPSRDIAGFMPLQRQFGFVFNSKTSMSNEEGKGNLAKTIAHEIGHGIFALQHPFTELKTEEGKTDWLMDYGNGIDLNHLNWAQIHNPELKFYIFQDEEDGELGGEIWFTPNWEPFSFKKEESKRVYTGKVHPKHVDGTVPGFILNGLTYYANYDDYGKFLDYKSNVGGSLNIDLTKNIPDNKKVFLYKNNGGCGKDYYATIPYKDYLEIKNMKEYLNNLSDYIFIPCSIDYNSLCDRGKYYFDLYKIDADSESEKNYLFKISKLLCDDKPKELIDAHLSMYKRFKGKAKNFAAVYNLKFSWEKYYQALQKLEEWRKKGISSLLQSDVSSEELLDRIFEIALQLDTEIITLIPLEQKVWMLVSMLDKKLYNLFTKNHDEAVAKLVSSIRNEEAKKFLDILISDEYKNSSDEPLLYVLKENLSDFLNAKNPYTQFFTELNRLCLARSSLPNEELDVKLHLNWDTEQKDYVLVSYVQNRNKFDFTYNNQNHTVKISTCVSCCYRGRKRCQPVREDLLPADSSPFDLVGLLIQNQVSPFEAQTAYNLETNSFEAQEQIVPAIFLDYLKTYEENQRLENAGWNIFNVVVTVATLGEGGVAIQAIRGASAARRLVVAKKYAYTLLDFTYTVSDNALKAAGVKMPEAWGWIGYAFAAKGGFDLIKNGGAKGIGYLRKLLKERKYKKLKEIISKLNIKKDGNLLTINDIDDFVKNAEAKIKSGNNAEFKDGYEEGLKFDGNNVGDSLIDDLVDSVEETYRSVLRADLEKSTKLSTLLKENPELLENWKKMKDLDVNPSLRQNPEVLKKTKTFNCK